VKSSWGKADCEYDGAGHLKRLTIDKQGEKAVIDVTAGLIRGVRQFDGGKIAISYFEEGEGASLPKQVICPDGLSLMYDYDTSARLSAVTVGNQRRLLLSYDNGGRVVGITWRPYDVERSGG